MKFLSKTNVFVGNNLQKSCPDIRNTKAIDVYNELKVSYGCRFIHPWANAKEVKYEFGVNLISSPYDKKYDTII